MKKLSISLLLLISFIAILKVPEHEEIKFNLRRDYKDFSSTLQSGDTLHLYAQTGACTKSISQYTRIYKLDSGIYIQTEVHEDSENPFLTNLKKYRSDKTDTLNLEHLLAKLPLIHNGSKNKGDFTLRYKDQLLKFETKGLSDHLEKCGHYNRIMNRIYPDAEIYTFEHFNPLIIEPEAVSKKRRALDTITTRLEAYFQKNVIKPVEVLKNDNYNLTRFSIAEHKIEWMSTEEESSIRIDKWLIKFKDATAINDLDEEVDFSNNWEQIRYYNYRGKEILEIVTLYYPCTGIGCSVRYILFYDLKTKVANHFGGMHAGNQLELFDFQNDGLLDFASYHFTGDFHMNTADGNFHYQLYSHHPDGQFRVVTNEHGKPYQIVLSYPPTHEENDDFTYRENWFEKIN